MILRCLLGILIVVMLQAPKQPKFFLKSCSFRKYLQYRKCSQKMPVRKFVLVQTFIKFNALQILPINKDCRFTIKYMNFLAFSKFYKQLPRNVLQKSCYASVVKILEFTKIQLFTDIFHNFLAASTEQLWRRTAFCSTTFC